MAGWFRGVPWYIRLLRSEHFTIALLCILLVMLIVLALTCVLRVSLHSGARDSAYYRRRRSHHRRHRHRRPSPSTDSDSSSSGGEDTTRQRRRDSRTDTEQRQSRDPLRNRFGRPYARTVASMPWKLKAPLRSFDGVAEDPGQWLNHVDRVFVLSALEDAPDALKTQVVSSHLLGQAQVWIDSIDMHSFRNFDDFRHAFVTRFRPAGFENKIQTLIQQLKQQKSEAVHAYGDRYMELVQLAGQSPDTFVRLWVEGLRVQYKRLVLFSDPQTFEEALDAALRSEVATEDDRLHGMRTGVSAGLSLQRTSGALPWVPTPNLEARTAEVAQESVTYTETSPTSSSLTGTAANQPGEAAECHTEHPANVGSPPKHSSPRHRCRYCGKLGHLEQRCWKKDADDRRRREAVSQGESSSGRGAQQDLPQQYIARLLHSNETHLTGLVCPCSVDGLAVHSVLLDPGSSRTFVDVSILKQLGSRLSGGHYIEGVNGLLDRSLGDTTKAVRVQVADVSHLLHVIAVTSRDAYDVLLGRDFLQAVRATADFGKDTYRLGGEASVEVKQIRRQIYFAPVEEAKQEGNAELPYQRLGHCSVGSGSIRTNRASDALVSLEPLWLPANSGALRDCPLTSQCLATIVEGQEECCLTDVNDEEGNAGEEPRGNDHRQQSSALTKSTPDVVIGLSHGPDVVLGVEEFPCRASIPCGLESSAPLRSPSLRLVFDPGGTLNINQELEDEEHMKLTDILSHFPDLFSSDLKGMPSVKICQHHINLVPGSRPFRARQTKRFSHREREFIDAEIERLLEAGVIRPHDGPWLSNITLAPKRDGKWRLCVAFCQLNDRTEAQHYPIPNISELLEGCSGFSYYTSLDAASAFYSIKLAPESQSLTGFTCGKASYCFQRMPFGLRNAPMTFSRAIREITRPLQDRHCLTVYMDDCLVHSYSLEQHLIDLFDTLQALQSGGLRLNPQKCRFGYRSAQFLGHLVSATGVQVDPDRTDALDQWEPPTDKAAVRRFLGVCGYYRRFVPNFAHKAEPLVRLLRGKDRYVWKWGQQEEAAFLGLKEAISAAMVLAPPDLTQPFELSCDASDCAVAGALSQNGRPIGFFSKTLSSCERRYSTGDREALAVVASFAHFRPLLHGSFTNCYTDHRAVVTALTRPEGSGRRARWADKLMEFSFRLRHRAGAQNVVADALSRMHFGEIPPQDHTDLEHMPSVIEARFSSVDEDAHLGPIVEYLRTGIARGETWVQRRRLQHEAKRFSIEDDTLMYLDGDGVLKVCVPASDVPALIAEYHGGNHYGRDLTVSAIRRLYWWKRMRRDVWQHLRQCETCQRFGRAVKVNVLKPLLASQPMEILEMDWIGALPVTNNGNRFILSCTCVLTRWIEAQAYRVMNTTETLSFLNTHVFARFGLPLVILTDRGTVFGVRFTQTLSRLNIRHHKASAQHPQTVGLEERSHGILLDRIRRFLLSGNVSRWDIHLPQAVYSVNTRVSADIPITPLEAMVGVGVRKPTELSLIAGLISKDGPNALKDRICQTRRRGSDLMWLRNRLIHLSALRDECANIREERALLMKRRYDAKVNAANKEHYDVGQQVNVREVGRIGKFRPRWIGPATVLWKSQAGDVYGVSLRGTEVVCNADRMRPWN